MGRVALPEMKRYKYSDRLATGAIAAGGTLGILIPPSTGFIIYAILVEESIGRLFLAGVLPGLLLTVLFMISIAIVTKINPKLGPPGEKSTMAQRGQSLVQAGPMLLIVLDHNRRHIWRCVHPCRSRRRGGGSRGFLCASPQAVLPRNCTLGPAEHG